MRYLVASEATVALLGDKLRKRGALTRFNTGWRSQPVSLFAGSVFGLRR